ncbi:hypothetical protein C8R47DRAFT_1232189 [Mycena vitilis]|nr:hypothetical protein C8R47DRAFT_1232189 [Mycena vitilis]
MDENHELGDANGMEEWTYESIPLPASNCRRNRPSAGVQMSNQLIHPVQATSKRQVVQLLHPKKPRLSIPDVKIGIHTYSYVIISTPSAWHLPLEGHSTVTTFEARVPAPKTVYAEDRNESSGLSRYRSLIWIKRWTPTWPASMGPRSTERMTKLEFAGSVHQRGHWSTLNHVDEYFGKGSSGGQVAVVQVRERVIGLRVTTATGGTPVSVLSDTLAEWLRRCPAKALGSPRHLSLPLGSLKFVPATLLSPTEFCEIAVKIAANFICRPSPFTGS